MEKVCFKCGLTLPLDRFYRHSGMIDGHLNKCKECNKKDVSKNRLDNIDYYREYDKKRSNNPNRVQARSEYAETEIGKDNTNKAKRKWIENNKIRHAVHLIVRNSVKAGRIFKPKQCGECNKTKRIEGHHDNYAFPLQVRWLCSKCHKDWHKTNEALNG